MQHHIAVRGEYFGKADLSCRLYLSKCVTSHNPLNSYELPFPLLCTQKNHKNI